MRLRYATLAVLIAGSLSALGCDSGNDDDGGGMSPPPGPPPNQGPMGGLESSGNFAVIAMRGAADDPYALDVTALGTDLASRFGDTGGEPLEIGEGEQIVPVANRGGR